MSDPFRIGETHQAIREGKIPCEENLKDGVLRAIADFGTINVKCKDGKVRGFWRSEDPLDIISEILESLETVVTTKKTLEHQDLDEESVEFHKMLRVQMYRIKRAVRNIIKGEGS